LIAENRNCKEFDLLMELNELQLYFDKKSGEETLEMEF
jgi:hypothetical protein